MEQRIIGRYEGHQDGPLLICIAAMHGNEPAGIEAIKEIFSLLLQEPSHNPGFQYRGNLIGLAGNVAALRKEKRYIDRDLNRMLSEEEIVRVSSLSPHELKPEESELKDLIRTIGEEIERYRPTLTLFLDLHTTTADGGIFTIAANDDISRQLAMGLFAPVILGIAEGLPGTTVRYLNRPDSHQYCIVFEAGQHQDPISTYRSVAAIVNCMRSIGSVEAHDVDHRHDGLLIGESIGLPKMTRLIYHHKITPGEIFVMNPEYENFQKIVRGEFLASNQEGPIFSPCDGLILMPKYQSQGDDGFFIVENLDL